MPVLFSQECNDLRQNSLRSSQEDKEIRHIPPPKALSLSTYSQQAEDAQSQEGVRKKRSPSQDTAASPPSTEQGVTSPSGGSWCKRAGVKRQPWAWEPWTGIAQPPACESASQRLLSDKGAEEQSSTVHVWKSQPRQGDFGANGGGISILLIYLFTFTASNGHLECARHSPKPFQILLV